jgi:hypothetical protein
MTSFLLTLSSFVWTNYDYFDGNLTAK